MLLVADVHGAAAALERVASLGQPLLVLGDLVNLIDYRSGEGIVADVVGLETVLRISELRSRGLHDEATGVWIDSVEGREADVRSAVGQGMRSQYERMRSALDGAEAYVMYGNVDRPDMLREHLPTSARFVDADVVEIGGWIVGFVGGGMPRLGTAGEISSTEMAEKLERIGDVDILCTHVPPAIEALGRDVVGGGFKGSVEVLDYIDRVQPKFHFFGDVHQPQATRWHRGTTTCRNVGYFRATGRPHEHV
ncbi:MAG: metallophosphoesterase [Actinomycetia bacterium]|nr:metallophosphoesterase [Actinomycetes bacterium]